MSEKEQEKRRLQGELEDFFDKYGIKDFMDVINGLFMGKKYSSLGEIKDDNSRRD